MNASFEEKSTWITLLGTLFVLGAYFFVALRMLVAGVTTVVPFIPVFTVAVILLVVLLVAGHVAVAIASRPDGRDERDRLISWRAEHNSSWLLATGVIAAAFALATPLSPAWIANGLLLFLFLAEVLNRVLRLYYYRRGM
jgi:hypothetical protein